MRKRSILSLSLVLNVYGLGSAQGEEMSLYDVTYN